MVDVLRVYLWAVEALLLGLQLLAAALHRAWCLVRGSDRQELDEDAVDGGGQAPAPPRTVAVVVAESEAAAISDLQIAQLLLW